MGLLDTFYFNRNKYTKKNRKVNDRQVLDRKHRRKVRGMSASAAAGTCGVAFAATTSGISLVGTVYSIRQFHVYFQQAKLLEDIMVEKQFVPPKARVKDIIIGMLIGGGAYAAGFGVAHGLEHLAHPIVQQLSSTSHILVNHHFQIAANTSANMTAGHAGLAHAAQHIASTSHLHDVSFEASSVIHHPSTAITNVFTGVREAFGTQSSHAAIGIANLADSAQVGGGSNAMASIAGQMAGIHLAHTGGNIAATQGVSYVTENWARRRDENNTLPPPDDTCELKAILPCEVLLMVVTYYVILLQILMPRYANLSLTLMMTMKSLRYWRISGPNGDDSSARSLFAKYNGVVVTVFGMLII